MRGGRTRLERNGKDLPFSMIYQVDAETGRLRRMAETGGIDRRGGARGGGTSPLTCHCRWRRSWPGRETRLIHDVSGVPGLPCGAWDQPPRQAVIVPIAQPGPARPAGVFIAGSIPTAPFDEAYAGFIDLVAAQIASGLGAARRL